jgi:hypothetical protein
MTAGHHLPHGVLAGGFAVLFLLAAAGNLSAQAPQPGFRVGVCTHFSQDKGLLDANLAVARQTGVTTIRDEVGWGALERTKDQLAMPEEFDRYVNGAVEAGIEPLLILDYGNRFYDNGDKPLSDEALEGFARYSEFVVRHFKGQVKLYEIWNEWDIAIGSKTPGTAESYAKLLKAVYPRIKKADPSITVLGGAMTPGAVRGPWLEQLLKAGALSALDEFSIHTYNYSATGRERSPEAWAEWMQQVQGLLRKYSGDKEIPLHVTEMGWPTQIDRRGTPPEVAAEYLARMYLLARTMPFMRGIWWYDFQDDGWRYSNNETNFGILRPDLTPKPAWFALAGIAALVKNAEYIGRVDAADPEVYILKFREPDGRDTWAIWSAHEDDGWQVTLRSATSPPPPVTIAEVGRRAVQRDWGTREWDAARRAPVVPNELTVVVRGMPWLITGKLEGVTVTGVRRREFPEATRLLQFMR